VLETGTYLKEKAKWIDDALKQYIQGRTEIPARLREAMEYSLLAGGKRIRPVLLLATVEALGGEERSALPFACAIEMIHTYSLIHDDLPAMDNDDFRRGKPTNHKVFGEAMAILAGDALLTEAFHLLAKGAEQTGISPEIALRIIGEVGQAAGAKGMVGGQVLDILSENGQITLSELETIHRHKTGDLIACSVRVGALLAQASEETLNCLTEFAYLLGLAFQIQDDILDVIGDQEKLGKPVGSDEEKNKATYPALLGLEESKAKLAECINKARQLIAGRADLNPERLLQIADFLLHRER
jgi:geranylgeranyl diphosphate synthase, type II